jgi:GNAT superfamily N-acetyltransferase
VSRTPVLVRDAVEDDAPTLCRLWADLFLRTGAEEVGGSVESMAVEAIERMRGEELHRILVAEVDGTVVGAAFLRLGMVSPLHAERAVHMSHLQVDRGYLRHGVGRSLVDASVAWAEHLGIDTMIAAAAVNDRDANRFMARYGLAQVATLRGASVAALRARLPVDPSTAVRNGGRSGRSIGQVVAVRRSQRRARSRDIVVGRAD